jgi:hypothetical protein
MISPVVHDVSPEADRTFTDLRNLIRGSGAPIAGTPVALKDFPTGREQGWQGWALDELVERGVLRRTTKHDAAARTTTSAVEIVEGMEDAFLVMPVSRRPVPAP